MPQTPHQTENHTRPEGVESPLQRIERIAPPAILLRQRVCEVDQEKHRNDCREPDTRLPVDLAAKHKHQDHGEQPDHRAEDQCWKQPPLVEPGPPAAKPQLSDSLLAGQTPNYPKGSNPRAKRSEHPKQTDDLREVGKGSRPQHREQPEQPREGERDQKERHQVFLLCLGVGRLVDHVRNLGRSHIICRCR